MLSHYVDTTRLTIQSDRGLIALEPRTTRAIRIRYTLEDEFSRKPSMSVMPRSACPSRVPFQVENLPEGLVLSTDTLSVEIDRQTLAFTYRDSAGGVLTREPSRGGKTLDLINVVVSVFDQAATVESRKSADGVRVDAIPAQQVIDRRAHRSASVRQSWAGHTRALYTHVHRRRFWRSLPH